MPFFYIPENQCVIFFKFQNDLFGGETSHRKTFRTRIVTRGEFWEVKCPYGEIWHANHPAGGNLGHEVCVGGGGGM